MGLERASSGLKVRDEFGSDTSANYDLEGANTLDISEGHATPSGYGICAHKSSSGTLCVTADMGQRYVCLMPAQTVSDYTHRDGYWLHNDGGTMRLMKFVDEASTALATASASGAMRLRIYVYDGVVYAKAGKVVDGTLPYGCSASNTDWTAPFQGAVYETPGQYFDNFDCRTSHLITCSGMTEGHYLRVSDGTTAAEAQESSGTATADAGAVLFPPGKRPDSHGGCWWGRPHR